jgi:uncharacterized protein (DUF1778 family)
LLLIILEKKQSAFRLADARLPNPECMPATLTERSCTDIIRAISEWHQKEVVAMTTVTRDDRIELRATKEEKRLLATAAAYERLDVTSFIMRNVLHSARKVVDRAERIVLSERDTERILQLLENPPKPSPALLAAARRRLARK